MRPHRLAHVAGLAGRVEPLELGETGVGLRRREPLGGAPQGKRLEGQADLEEVAELVDVEVEDTGTLVRDVLREPERLELPDGLTDRRDAHPERACELVEAERGARGQVAEDDRLAELLEGELRHRPVAHPAGGGIRHVLTVPNP